MSNRSEAAEILFSKIAEAGKELNVGRPAEIGQLGILAEAYAKVAEFTPATPARSGRSNIT